MQIQYTPVESNPGMAPAPELTPVQPTAVTTKRKMKYYPDPILRTNCTEVTVFDESLKDLSDDMLAWMERRPAYGLAAPQVGDTRRVLAYKVDDRLDVLVNPVLTPLDEEQIVEVEGCLSMPGFTLKVPRHKRVMVSYKTVDGQARTMHAEGLLSVVLQQEVDHLNGKLFVDYLPPVKKDVMLRKYKKMMKQISTQPQTYQGIEKLLSLLKE